MGQVLCKQSKPSTPPRKNRAIRLHSIPSSIRTLPALPNSHSARAALPPQTIDPIRHLRTCIAAAVHALQAALHHFGNEMSEADWYVTPRARDALWRARLLYPTQPPYMARHPDPREIAQAAALRLSCNELARSLHAVGRRGDVLGMRARGALGVLGSVGEGPAEARLAVEKLRELEALVGGTGRRCVVMNYRTGGVGVDGYLPFRVEARGQGR